LEETKEPEPESVQEEERQPQIIYSPPLAEETGEPEPTQEVAEVEQPAIPEPVMQATPEPYHEPVTRKTPVAVAGTDQMLGLARNELSRSNIPGALDSYAKLIKKGRFLEEVIYDLREALYRYPVEVNIWQSLGDAYMRANRLQDALDAYTKAEELLR
jgi:tetratricopeptide (TPR) repeat protein